MHLMNAGTWAQHWRKYNEEENKTHRIKKNKESINDKVGAFLVKKEIMILF